MEQRNHRPQTSKKDLSTGTRTKSVLEMSRHELLHFLEEYIALLIEKKEYEDHHRDELRRITQNKSSAQSLLDNRYEQEYNELFNERAQRMKDKFAGLANTFYSYEPPRYIFIAIGLWIFFQIRAKLIKDAMPFVGGTSYFLQSVLLAIPLYLFRNIIWLVVFSILRFIALIVHFIFSKIDLANAQKLGITKDNFREHFQYDLNQQQIEERYAKLRTEFNEEMQNRLLAVNHKLQPYYPYLPSVDDFRSIPNMMIIYNSIQTGRADTWKESLEVLSKEIKHQETIQNLNYVTELGQQFLQESQTMSNRMAQIQNEINNFQHQTASKLDELQDRVVESTYNQYATVDVYHHSSDSHNRR